MDRFEIAVFEHAGRFWPTLREHGKGIASFGSFTTDAEAREAATAYLRRHRIGLCPWCLQDDETGDHSPCRARRNAAARTPRRRLPGSVTQ